MPKKTLSVLLAALLVTGTVSGIIAVSSEGGDPPAVVCAAKDPSNVFQQWRYEYAGLSGGYDSYYLRSMATGKYLTVQNDHTISFMHKSAEPQYFQKWQLHPASGYVYITNMEVTGTHRICLENIGGGVYGITSKSVSYNTGFKVTMVGPDAAAKQAKNDAVTARWGPANVGQYGVAVFYAFIQGGTFPGCLQMQGDISLAFRKKDLTNPYQQWQYDLSGADGGDSLFTLKNEKTGLYLTRDPADDSVSLEAKSGGAAQDWIIKNAGGLIYLVNRQAGADFSLTFDSYYNAEDTVQSFTSVEDSSGFLPAFVGENAAAKNASFAANGFDPEAAGGAIGDSGLFVLDFKNHGFALGADDHPAAQANPELAAGKPFAEVASSDLTVKWSFEKAYDMQDVRDGVPVTAPVFRIGNPDSGKYLTSRGDNTVAQEDFNGRYNQLWEILEDGGSDEYLIKNVQSGRGLYISSSNAPAQEAALSWSDKAYWYFVDEAADISGVTGSGTPNPNRLDPGEGGVFLLAERASMTCLAAVTHISAVDASEFIQNFQMPEGSGTGFTAGSSGGQAPEAKIVKNIGDNGSNILRVDNTDAGAYAYVQDIPVPAPMVADPRGIFFRLKTNAPAGASVGVALGGVAGKAWYGFAGDNGAATGDASYVSFGGSDPGYKFAAEDGSDEQIWEYGFARNNGTFDLYTIHNATNGLYLTLKADQRIVFEAARGDASQEWALDMTGNPAQNRNLMYICAFMNGQRHYLFGSAGSTAESVAFGNSLISASATGSSFWMGVKFAGENAAELQEIANNTPRDYTLKDKIGEHGQFRLNFKNLGFYLTAQPQLNKKAETGATPGGNFDGYVFVPVFAQELRDIANIGIVFSDGQHENLWDNTVSYIDDIGYYGAETSMIGLDNYISFAEGGVLPKAPILQPTEVDKAMNVETEAYPQGEDEYFWLFTQVGDSWLLSNKATGGFLTANADGKIYQDNYTGSDNQLWTLQSKGGGGYYLIDRGLNKGVYLDAGRYRRPLADLTKDVRTDFAFFLSKTADEANGFVGGAPKKNAPVNGEYFIFMESASRRALKAATDGFDDGGTTAPAAKVALTSPETGNADTVLCKHKVKMQAVVSGLPAGMSGALQWSVVGDPGKTNSVIADYAEENTPPDTSFKLVQFLENGNYVIRAALKADPSVYGDYKVQAMNNTAGLTEAVLAASDLFEIDYTIDSWKIFSDVIAGARALAEDPNARQREIDRAAADVGAAAGKLVSCYNADTNESVFKISAPIVVSAQTLDTAFSTGRILVYNMVGRDRKTLYTWRFDGNNIIGESGGWDLSIGFTSPNRADIELASGTAENAYINCAQTGKLPAPAEIRAYVGDRFKDGALVNLYYLNPVVTIGQPVEENLTVTDGYITFKTQYGADFFANAAPVTEAPKAPPEDEPSPEPEPSGADEGLTLDAVRQAIEATQGNVVVLRLKGENVLTAEMQQALKDAGKTVRVELADAADQVYLVQQLQSIGAITGDIALGLNAGPAYGDVFAKTASGAAYQILSFKHRGPLPGKMSVIAAKDEKLDKTKPLSLFAAKNGKSEYLDTPVSVSNDDRYLAFTIAEGGEYAVINKSTAPEAAAQPGPSVPVWAWVIAAAAFAAGAAAAVVALVLKKRGANKR